MYSSNTLRANENKKSIIKMYLFLCFCMLHNQIINKIIPLKANQVFNNRVYEK